MALLLPVAETRPPALPITVRAVSGPLAADIGRDFAHALAHDVRSPLTAIQMCAESLLHSDDPDMRRRYCRIILEQARCLAWTMDDLVTVADDEYWCRDEATRSDLSELTRCAVADVQALAEARMVRLVRNLAPGPVPVHGFEAALRQAMRGCMEAVLMVTPQHGSVQVTVMPLTSPDSPPGGCVEIVARRGPDSPAPAPGGAGLKWRRLGFHAAVQIIHGHHGSVSEIRSPSGLGIRVTLPERTS